ncbi:hypothetical protein L218DRAFT_998454 [Marasmius fiardii PR-910]|nr:hypothetical protein L218DRAFT_998454 [Marasmius fiardii PR-910]
MDDLYYSSTASSSSRLLEDAYSSSSCYLPSISSPFLLLLGSYTSSSCTRQSAYAETSSERRARLEFLQKEVDKEAMKKEDRARCRVASWVQTQVENSAFVVMAAAAQNQKKHKRSSSRHHRTEPRIAGQRSGSPLRFSYIPSYDDCEESEEQIQDDVQDYNMPLSKSNYPTSLSSCTSKTPTPHPMYSTSPRPTKCQRSRRPRTRRLASSTSSLDSIPEE